MKERIYLAGGGNERDSAKLDGRFVQELRDRGISRLIYLPIALRPERYESAAKWFKGIFENRVPQIDVLTDLSSKDIERDISESGIYIGGGNAVRLLTQIRESGFDRRLVDFIKNGGVVYGGSAGAIILGKDIRTAPETKNVVLESYNGLGVLNGYSVTCHYDRTENSKMNYLVVSQQINSPIIAITEKGGVIVQNNQIDIIGDQEVSILYNNKEEVLNATSGTPLTLPNYL